MDSAPLLIDLSSVSQQLLLADWQETFLEGANIQEVKNCDNIFSGLHGYDPDYDSQVFDVIAEVRFIRWARENGYSGIEKLVPNQTTPDFLLTKQKETTIAEAKHFRERDYLLEFVYDRIRGLFLKTGLYLKLGLEIEATQKYEDGRDNMVKQNSKQKAQHIQRARVTMPVNILDKLLNKSCTSIELLEGLIIVRTTSNVPFFQMSSPFVINPMQTFERMISKLEGEFLSKLTQIKCFMDAQTGEISISNALVFLSGTNPQDKEWDTMWDVLCRFNDDCVWQRVYRMHQEGQKVVDIPFVLIVGMGIPPRYDHFPWTREECGKLSP
ncbi:hypothetical protein ACFLXF_03600 [Chloroflexota bacterium]